ncbi:MAG TPA: hypothetical protein VIC34_09420 [Croceibacterium sp.]|jgi:hypothetical protein
MKSVLAAAGLACASFGATPAVADPGFGEEVYGATIEPGETEVEAQWGRLAGGADDGEDGLKLEAAHNFIDRVRAAVAVEFEREAGGSREAEALSAEAIYRLGRVGGIDAAVYGEYEIGFDGPEGVETKLLLQRRAGPWDLRLNLIAKKELKHGAPVALGYAASADVAAIGDLRLGFEAFGELGTTRKLLPRAEHFAGPAGKLKIEGLGPELELRAGYLFALGEAKDTSDGQLRIGLEIEF